MSRLVDVPVEVEARAGHVPSRIRWRGRWLQVQAVLDSWAEAGEWWKGEPSRTLFLVECQEGGVYEVCREAVGGWRLLRVLD